MDLSKQLDFLNPEVFDKEQFHIIGLGAIGSSVAEMLCRMGVSNFHLYDFDIVEPKNLCNQTFWQEDIGQPKIAAVHTNLQRINPQANIVLHPQGWTPTSRLADFIFLCVDSIELRKQIVTQHHYNPLIKALFDFRMGLTDAQAYACDWSEPQNVTKLLTTMAFTDEEAQEAMPVSACGTSLSVIPTVRNIVCLGLANWVNFVKTKTLKTIILSDSFYATLQTF